MIDMKMKRFFFDRAAVINAMDKATHGALSKAGAFIMRAARTSMRRRSGFDKKGQYRFGRGKKPRPASPPGKPPFSWKESGQLRDRLFFAFDPRTKSVVIGPEKFGSKAEVPPLHEFGGKAVRRSRSGKTRVASYPRRPYMFPALEKESPKLPSRWANSIRPS